MIEAKFKVGDEIHEIKGKVTSYHKSHNLVVVKEQRSGENYLIPIRNLELIVLNGKDDLRTRRNSAAFPT